MFALTQWQPRTDFGPVGEVFTHAGEHIVFPDSHLNPDFDHGPPGQARMLFLFLLGPEAPLDVVAPVLD